MRSIIYVYEGIVFTCSNPLLFPYQVSADINGSVRHVTLGAVPGDVLPKLVWWFNHVKHLECHYICPPQEVHCVCLYSVDWDASLLYQSLFDRSWGGGSVGCVGLCGGSYRTQQHKLPINSYHHCVPS